MHRRGIDLTCENKTTSGFEVRGAAGFQVYSDESYSDNHRKETLNNDCPDIPYFLLQYARNLSEEPFFFIFTCFSLRLATSKMVGYGTCQRDCCDDIYVTV